MPPVEAIRYVGLDLGQLRDYTALTVVEQSWPLVTPTLPATSERREDYQVGAIWRPNIGTSYRSIVSYVAGLLRRESMADNVAALVVDATGVGRPVVELLREARLPVEVIAVTITSGMTATQVARDEFHVPKRDLAGELSVLLQVPDPNVPTQARLRVANLTLAPILKAELANFKAKINSRGHDSYEAGPAGDWREGEHDDVVLAVALPVWYARRGQYLAQGKHPPAGPPYLGGMQRRTS